MNPVTIIGLIILAFLILYLGALLLARQVGRRQSQRGLYMAYYQMGIDGARENNLRESKADKAHRKRTHRLSKIKVRHA